MELTQSVHLSFDQNIALIKLVQPQNANRLNPALVSGLQKALDQAQTRPDCRVICLMAEGQIFCSGMDFEAVLNLAPESYPAYFQQFGSCLLQIAQSPLPVVAIVNGEVAGGGVGLIAACDIVLAGPQASFKLPEVILGMFPALITPFLLQRLSVAQLRYLTLSTRTLTPVESQMYGLVDELASSEIDLENKIHYQLQAFLRSAPAALARAKSALFELALPNLEQQVQLACTQLVEWLSRPTSLDGLQQFSEGFSPEWFQKYRRSNLLKLQG